jgi:prevent-host-death family protein
MPHSRQQISKPGYRPEAVSIRQLGKHPSEVINVIERGGKPVVVTRKGEPAVYIVPIDFAERHLPRLVDYLAPDD